MLGLRNISQIMITQSSRKKVEWELKLTFALWLRFLINIILKFHSVLILTYKLKKGNTSFGKVNYMSCVHIK